MPVATRVCGSFILLLVVLGLHATCEAAANGVAVTEDPPTPSHEQPVEEEEVCLLQHAGPTVHMKAAADQAKAAAPRPSAPATPRRGFHAPFVGNAAAVGDILPDSGSEPSAADEGASLAALAVSQAIEGPETWDIAKTTEEHNEEIQPARVLFVVYSGSEYYHNRVKSVIQTWGHRVLKRHILVVGDVPSEIEGVRVAGTSCAAHDHGMGMCCKYGEAVIHALDVLRKDTSLDWAYFLDDDTYLRPHALAMALARFPAKKTEGAIAAFMGCQAGAACQGICGGGGYAANRAALEKVLSVGAESFLKEQMTACSLHCENWADVALTQVFKARHLSMQPLQGVYPFALTKPQFDASLSSQAEPLLYHYIGGRNQYTFLDELFTNSSNTFADTPSVGETMCVKYKNVRRCATSESGFDLPWRSA